MEKRTLYALVVMAVLGIGAYAALRAPDKGQRSGPPPRPVAAMKAAEIGKLEITTQRDEHTTLEKKGDRWRVTAPTDWPADAQAVKALTEAIEKLSFGDVVTENPEKHAELGVAEKGSVHLKIGAGSTTVELLIGQTVGGFSMVRLAGKNEVWQGNNFPPYVANKPPKDWRDHVLFELAANEVERLKVEVPGGSKLVLEKIAGAPAADGKPASPGWKVAEASGDAPQPADALDASQPTTVAQALAALRANDFADGKDAKEAGFEPPSLVITASSKGKTQALEIGAQSGDDLLVRKAGEATIFVVKKYLLDRVLYRPIDYRDKTLLAYKLEDIARLHVVQGKDDTSLAANDGAWLLAGGAAADEAKAKAMLGGVDNLQAQGFVTDKTTKTDLDKPRALISVEPRSGAKRTLKVGALTKDQGEYYVAVEGGKEVYRAKKFAIDRLLKKPADLQAGTKMPSPIPMGHPPMGQPRPSPAH